MLAVEMEAAVLFTLGALRGVKAGCLLTVSDIVVEGEFVRISDEEMRAAVDQMTELALHDRHRARTISGKRRLPRQPGVGQRVDRPALARARARRAAALGLDGRRALLRRATATSPSSRARRPRAAPRCSSPSAATAR